MTNTQRKWDCMGKGEMRYRRLHRLAPILTSRSQGGPEEDLLFSQPW